MFTSPMTAVISAIALNKRRLIHNQSDSSGGHAEKRLPEAREQPYAASKPEQRAREASERAGSSPPRSGRRGIGVDTTPRPSYSAFVRVALLGLISLFLASVVSPPLSAAPTVPRNDYLVILDHRTGPFAYLHSFDKGGPEAYTSALAAFGQPSSFKTDGNLCRVTWQNAGITVGFASALRPCSTGQLFHSSWYGLSLWGTRWHNQLGLRIGQTIAQVRRLYPNARFDTNLNSQKLVLLRKRVDEFNFIHLAVIVDRSGRVNSIEVPATYIY
jgi:hypothetical protein